MTDYAGLAALIVAVSGYIGLWYQRRRDIEAAAAARAKEAKEAKELEAEKELEHIRLVRDIENERLSSFKAELAELRTQLKAERDTSADLLTRLEKLEHENRALRMYGRKEDQERIAELEKRVASLEKENNTLRGG